MTGGTYTLIVTLSEPVTITVGALGEQPFDAGWYAYVGSALGPGGFSRIERHRELAAGKRDVRHWHLDYLLGHPAARLADVVRTADADGECQVARHLSTACQEDSSVHGKAISGFGCTDCGCESHLFYAREREAVLASVEEAHDRIR